MNGYDTGELLLAVSKDGSAAIAVPVTTLQTAGLLERQHLEEWLVVHPEVFGDGVMVVATEYDGWVVSGDPQRDRLDILGLNQDGRLVVVELKRGIAPDTVDMQAIKYAAMASRFHLETLAAAFVSFKAARGAAISIDEAIEVLQGHAPSVSDDTLASPRVVVVAQGFSPVVISSVVWLAERGIDLTLIRFQPYQHSTGEVFVTFSRLYPLPDIEKSIVKPGTPATEIPTDALPVVEWTAAELVMLGRIANVTTRTALDLCAEKPEEPLTFDELLVAASVPRAQARGHLASLTNVTKRRFGRRNWPFVWRLAKDAPAATACRTRPRSAGTRRPFSSTPSNRMPERQSRVKCREPDRVKMPRRYLAFDIETAKVLPAEVGDVLAHRPLGIA